MSTQQHPGLMRRLKGIMMKRMHSMITCAEFEEFIMDYLDGSLPRAQRKKFRFHMRLCRECREYLAAYQRTMELGREVLGSPYEPVPDDVPEDLIKAVLDSREK